MAERGWSGGCWQPCSGDAAGDLTVDDAEGSAERGRSLGLVARHERAQDAVVDLGVEDREPQAVGGEGIQGAARDPGDQPVAGQAGGEGAGLGYAVRGAAEGGG